MYEMMDTLNSPQCKSWILRHKTHPQVLVHLLNDLQNVLNRFVAIANEIPYIHDLSRNAQRAWWRWFLQELECDAGAIAVVVGDIINVPVGPVQELPDYLHWHPEHPPNGFIRVPPTLPPHGGPIVPPQPPNDPIGPIGPIGPPENPSNDELSDASSSQSGFNNPDDSSDPDNSETLEYHIHTIPDQRL